MIEILLAIGIISFALVGVLGMFPAAVKAANDSQQETQAALIARSVYDQLQTRSDDPVRKISLARSLDSPSPSVNVNLAVEETLPVIGYDVGGQPLEDAGNPDAVYQVSVRTNPIALPGGPASGLSEVHVTVKSRNKAFPFVSIFRQR